MDYGRRAWPKVWFLLIALDTAIEVWALRNSRREATLSYATRQAFRTHTKLGRLAFAACWVALTAWFLPHVVDPKD